MTVTSLLSNATLSLAAGVVEDPDAVAGVDAVVEPAVAAGVPVELAVPVVF